MTNLLETFFKAQMETLAFLNKTQRLAGVWRLDDPTWLWDYSDDCTYMELKRTVRITEKQCLRIVDGKIVDCKVGEKPTALVEEIWGTERPPHHLILKDIVTKEKTTFKL